MTAAAYQTRFGSLKHYEKGRVEPIDDDVRHYAFSNCFEIASNSRPYEKVVFGQNQIYVLEVLRAEGTSPWYTADHDEFALVMDGTVEVRLQKPGDAQLAKTGTEGAVLLKGDPAGPKMGRITCKRGHMALLPRGSAYQFHAASPGVVTIQTIQGALTIERWAEICETKSS